MTLETFFSLIAFLFSVVSMAITFQQNRRALKIQLFEPRIKKYNLMSALIQAIKEHETALKNDETLAINARLQLNCLINNTAFNTVYKLIQKHGYSDYNQEVLKEIDRLRQEAISITLVFVDNEFSQKAQHFVETYVETVYSLYMHQVFATKRHYKEMAPKIRTTDVVTPQSLKDCEKSLEDRRVMQNLHDMIDAFEAFENSDTLIHIKDQVNLSKPGI